MMHHAGRRVVMEGGQIPCSKGRKANLSHFLQNPNYGRTIGTHVPLPSARIIRENLETLELTDQAKLVKGNAFLWDRAEADAERPWCVFCCPPYKFFETRLDQMSTLISGTLEKAPAGSIIVVEAEIPFDFEPLAELGEWDVRTYRPAVIGILEKMG
ncbi:hypothetical protein ACFL2H_02945 [Planctomycetota bacterium]